MLATSTGKAGEILVRWDPPLEYQQNGVINKYLIRLTHLETGQNRDILVDSFLLQYKISGLLLGHLYGLSVSGRNVDGFGPYSASVTVRTGTFILYTMLLISMHSVLCRIWSICKLRSGRSCPKFRDPYRHDDTIFLFVACECYV